MKKIKIISLCVLGAIVVSCGTSNNVVSGKLISKRKVNKGFHINTSHNLKGHGEEENTVKRAEFIQYTEEAKVVSQTADVVSDVVVNNQVSDAVVSDAIVVTENIVSNSVNEEVVATNNSSSTVDLKKVNKISKEEKQAIKKAVKAAKKESKKGGDIPVGLLYVLCVLIPWLAVGLATDWDIKVVIYNLLWTLLCGIPGIIHAFIVVAREN